MKLSVDLSALLEQPGKMGDPVVVEIKETRLPPLTDKGVEVGSAHNIGVIDGLLSHGNKQIVLYIQDHGAGFENALISSKDARRLHVAECKTIKQKRADNTFEKYVMSNNPTGKFYITDGRGLGEYVNLDVCMNCLEKLNYKGYQQKTWPERTQIVRQFHAEEFFEKYSSFFDELPKRQAGVRDGYTDDWPAISRKIREAASFRCDECHVDLSAYPQLLHTHHINGVKRDNNKHNLKALCIDCHSKAPNHQRMYVPSHDRKTIARLRREQVQVNLGSGWDAIARFADPAAEGLISQCRAAGVPAPDEYGAEVKNDEGEVVANLALAWWGPKVGVAISQKDINAARKIGWRVDAVNYTIEHVNQLRGVLR